MKTRLFVFAILSSLYLTAIAQPCREVIAYYPGWQWYDRNKLVDPASIDYSKYSIINFAFFSPKADASILGTDPYSDEILLKGEINWSTTPPSYYPNTSLIDLAHNHGVKVLISLGGWNDSQHFPAIAADPAKRALFAHNCINLCSFYNLDGIDIDWEYPGYAPNGGTPADEVNFTLLLQQVRDSLTAFETVAGHPLLLTSCFSASTLNMQNIDWPQVLPLLNSVNLMSYDFFGSWDAETNHNSPLYAPTQGDQLFNLDAAVQELINVHNVPPDKINAGVAFYGRSVKTNGAPALFGSSLMQPDNATFWEDAGTPQYYNILNKMNLFTAHFDAQARVPYLLGTGNLNTFVSYDNEQSIAEKAAYIMNHALRGAIIWELTGDYIESSPGSGIVGATPLADTLNAVFCGVTSNYASANNTGKADFRLCGSVITTQDESSGYDIHIYSAGGSMLLNQNLKGNYTLPEASFSPGVYLIRIQSREKMFLLKWVVVD
jgi:chitinase